MTFFTQGIISVVFRWIKNDCKGKIDTMINLIQHCVGRVD
ncbi:MAG: TetR family transcriptional regulator C-terminal domain-containing protein [Clostridium sp.]|nr:TetR family transcriptional regulator C-terminal domain-containing protein [Clostridium sp.]